MAWTTTLATTMRRGTGLALLALAVLTVGGCGLFGLGGDGGDGDKDAGVAEGDMASGPPDLIVPPDLALPPDMNNSFILATWNVLNFNLSGKMGGFPVNCDDPDAGAKEVEISVTNAGNRTAKTTTPCTPGASVGNTVLSVPDPSGPYTVTGVLVGRPSSVGEKVKNVMPTKSVTVRIYSHGCDNGPCL